MNFKGIFLYKMELSLKGIEYPPKEIENILKGFFLEIESDFKFMVNFFFGPIQFKGDCHLKLKVIF